MFKKIFFIDLEITVFIYLNTYIYFRTKFVELGIVIYGWMNSGIPHTIILYR